MACLELDFYPPQGHSIAIAPDLDVKKDDRIGLPDRAGRASGGLGGEAAADIGSIESDIPAILVILTHSRDWGVQEVAERTLVATLAWRCPLSKRLHPCCTVRSPKKAAKKIK